MQNTTIYNVQLKYYNFSLFQLSSVHVQGVHINYIYLTKTDFM